MRNTVKNNLRSLGFDKEVENVESDACPFCGINFLSKNSFRDALSYKEFQISGLCQTCQDKMFS